MNKVLLHQHFVISFLWFLTWKQVGKHSSTTNIIGKFDEDYYNTKIRWSLKSLEKINE